LIVPLIGILVMSAVPTANASKLSASIEEDHITLTISACIYQNITSLPSKSFEMNATTMADGETMASISAVGNAFNITFQRRVATASARDFRLEFLREGYWFNVTVSSDVYGVIKTEDNRPKVDMSWKVVNISDGMSVHMPGGGQDTVGINFAGRLFEAAIRLLIAAGDLTGDVTFYTGDQQITEEQALDLVHNLRLFDLSVLRKPLEEWERTYDSARDTTRFTYDGGSTLDLTIRFSNPQPDLEGSAVRVYIDPSGEIETGGKATATGDTITYPSAPWYSKTICLAAIAAIVIVVVVCAGYFMRIKI